MTSGCFDSLLKLHFTLTATQLVCHLLLLFPARCEIIQFEKITFPQIKHISTNRKYFYCIYDIYDVNL